MGTVILGNPRHYTTFLNEACNGKVAAVCRPAHRACWERSLMFNCSSRYAKKGAKLPEKGNRSNEEAKRLQVVHYDEFDYAFRLGARNFKRI